MKKQTGGGVDQRALLTSLETILGKGAAETAEALGTNYNTYKEWKGGRREMLGPALKLSFILIDIAGTPVGKLHGV